MKRIGLSILTLILVFSFVLYHDVAHPQKVEAASTFYLDYENGNDANAGDSFAAGHPWKTITSGATAARIGPGDIIKIAKSPAPVGQGFATWTSLSKTVTLTAQTSVAFSDGGGGLILATKAGHNFTTGDIVTISATTDYNGTYAITVASSSTFTFTCAYISDQSGTVTPALTKTIDLCEANWTSVHATSSARIGTDWKQGTYALKMVEDGTPGADEVQAYSATGTLDLSKYQKISFWIKNEVAVLANQLELNLCTNADGTGEVDTFPIPAIPSTGRWLPLTIVRNTGGNLNSAVASINISNGSSATKYTASKYVYIDDVIACTTSGLNLQSLISKNSLEQGGTEGWYGIQSINGVTILLDNDTNTLANAGRGYSTTGTSPDIVATYKRETIKTALASSSSTQVQAVQDSGTLALGNIEFQGGYDTGTGSQTGETFFDGLNGYGYGIYGTAKTYITFNKVNVSRYDRGYVMTSNSYYWNVTALNISNNTTYHLNGSSYGTLNITNLNNGGNFPLLINPGSFSTLTSVNINNNLNSGFAPSTSNTYITAIITNACNNATNGIDVGILQNITVQNTSYNASAGIYISSGDGSIVRFTTSNYNTYGISDNGANGRGVIIYGGSTTGNTSYAIFVANAPITNIINLTTTETLIYNAGLAVARNSRLVLSKYTGDINDNRIFSDGASDVTYGLINSQTAVRHTASGIAWRFSPDSTRTSIYPASLSVAKVAVVANKAVTIKIWAKVDSTANITGQLRVPGYQIAGVDTNVTQAFSSADTDWHEITMPAITPTENGVIEVFADAWYVAGNSYAYVDDMTITQAD
jgi:hypothetical protein